MAGTPPVSTLPLRIFDGQGDITSEGHPLRSHAQEILNHARLGCQATHRQPGYIGTAAALNALVNGHLLHGNNLETILQGKANSREKAQAIRASAYAARTITWEISEAERTFTLTIPLAQGQNPSLFQQPEDSDDVRLALNQGSITLTLHYNRDRFRSSTDSTTPPSQASTFGRSCDDIIDTVRHAIDHAAPAHPPTSVAAAAATPVAAAASAPPSPGSGSRPAAPTSPPSVAGPRRPHPPHGSPRGTRRPHRGGAGPAAAPPSSNYRSDPEYFQRQLGELQREIESKRHSPGANQQWLRYLQSRLEEIERLLRQLIAQDTLDAEARDLTEKQAAATLEELERALSN